MTVRELRSMLFEIEEQDEEITIEKLTEMIADNEKKYYDPEYDRMVNEDYIRNQYDWFSKQPWFNKDYETFKRDNFIVKE